MTAAGRILVGCSGWNYRDWRDGVFYPARLPAREWLSFYARQLPTVELNSTFYRLPRRSAAERWAEQAPDGFTFAVKVSRFVTHIKRLQDARQHLSLLLERIEPLVGSHRLGPLLWQLPPTFRRDDDRLARRATTAAQARDRVPPRELVRRRGAATARAAQGRAGDRRPS